MEKIKISDIIETTKRNMIRWTNHAIFHFKKEQEIE